MRTRRGATRFLTRSSATGDWAPSPATPPSGPTGAGGCVGVVGWGGTGGSGGTMSVRRLVTVQSRSGFAFVSSSSNCPLTDGTGMPSQTTEAVSQRFGPPIVSRIE